MADSTHVHKLREWSTCDYWLGGFPKEEFRLRLFIFYRQQLLVLTEDDDYFKRWTVPQRRIHVRVTDSIAKGALGMIRPALRDQSFVGLQILSYISDQMEIIKADVTEQDASTLPFVDILMSIGTAIELELMRRCPTNQPTDCEHIRWKEDLRPSTLTRAFKKVNLDYRVQLEKLRVEDMELLHYRALMMCYSVREFEEGVNIPRCLILVEQGHPESGACLLSVTEAQYRAMIRKRARFVMQLFDRPGQKTICKSYETLGAMWDSKRGGKLHCSAA